MSKGGVHRKKTDMTKPELTPLMEADLSKPFETLRKLGVEVNADVRSCLSSLANKLNPEGSKHVLETELPGMFTKLHEAGIPLNLDTLRLLDNLAGRTNPEYIKGGLITDALPTALKGLRDSGTLINPSAVERAWGCLNKMAKNHPTYYYPSAISIISGETWHSKWGKGKLTFDLLDALPLIQVVSSEDFSAQLEFGLPFALRALEGSQLHGIKEQISWLASYAGRMKPESFLGFTAYALPAALSAMFDLGHPGDSNTLSKAGDLAVGFANSIIFPAYMMELIHHDRGGGYKHEPAQRLRLVELYSSPLPEEERERVRSMRVYIHADEVASFNAIRGLLDSTGFRNVTIGYKASGGVEIDDVDVFLELRSQYSRNLLEATLGNGAFMRRVKERVGESRFTEIRGEAGGRLSNPSSKFGPINVVEPQEYRRDEEEDRFLPIPPGELKTDFFICFHDRPPDHSFESGRVGYLGYQPFKFRVPEPATEEKKSIIRQRLGVSEKDKVVVLGSPSEKETEIFTDAYSSLPDGERPLLVIAPRNLSSVPAIQQHLQSKGLNSRLRTDASHHGERVLILNTMGELRDMYAVADRDFVGSDRNPLEPASQGKHVFYFTGPWFSNSMALDVLAENGVATPVSTSDDIYSLLKAIHQPEDASERQRAFGAVRELKEKVIPQYADIVLKIAHSEWEWRDEFSRRHRGGE